jgi:murein DD-endopeptidase MepM/ murein hydrolase activator NlpD
MNIIRRLAVAAGSLILATALTPGALAHAAAPTKVPAQAEVVTRVFETVVTAADLAPVMTTTARPGEGVIRITTRICGNANNWQNVAASNSVKPPVYLVLLGQQLTVACVGTSAPAPAQQRAAPPAPAAGARSWVQPVCGVVGDSLGAGRNHKGVDLSIRAGTPIRAAAAGTVSVAYESGGAGYYTMINHGGGLWTVYMHQSRYAVTSGWVNAGQVIGYVGSTGNSTGPHLHFEVHPSGLWGARAEPLNFMAARGASLYC